MGRFSFCCCFCRDHGNPAGAGEGWTFIDKVTLPSALATQNVLFSEGGDTNLPAGTYRVQYSCGALKPGGPGGGWVVAMQNNTIAWNGGQATIPLMTGATQRDAEKLLYRPLWTTGSFVHGGGPITYHYEDLAGPPFYADNKEGDNRNDDDATVPGRNGSRKNPAFALFRLDS